LRTGEVTEERGRAEPASGAPRGLVDWARAGDTHLAVEVLGARGCRPLVLVPLSPFIGQAVTMFRLACIGWASGPR
jgi:hypothetical protein